MNKYTTKREKEDKSSVSPALQALEALRRLFGYTTQRINAGYYSTVVAKDRIEADYEILKKALEDKTEYLPNKEEDYLKALEVIQQLQAKITELENIIAKHEVDIRFYKAKAEILKKAKKTDD